MESIDLQEKWDAFLVNSKELYIKLRPIIQYGMIVFSIFLGISLLSYDPMDLRSVHSSHPIANAGGILGAFLSKQLLAYLGFGAWSCLLMVDCIKFGQRPIGDLSLYCCFRYALVRSRNYCPYSSGYNNGRILPIRILI